MAGTEFVDTDVLVVGGGLAGCWAALRASQLGADVILADKGRVARSGDAVFCHDILAPCPESERSVMLDEIVKHAEYMCDQSFAQVLFEEEGDRIRDLVSWGVPFERDEKGQLSLCPGRGHITSRVVLCDCRKLMEVMRKQLLKHQVKLAERIMVTDLLTSDGEHPTIGRVIGAVGLHIRTGQFKVFRAKAVVVSTGVVGFKLHSQYADNLTGDGQAMALRAGAEMAGLEFGFSPRFLGIHNGRLFTQSLMPFQTLGAHFKNARGERFMARYIPEGMERRSSCGLLALATTKEFFEGRGPVFMDLTHFGPEEHAKFRRILPLRMAPFDEVGIDVTKQPVEVKSLPTFLSGGGVRIDTEGQSSLPGLLAGGIASHAGAGEWVSGAMLGICNVFGYRAGEQAYKISRDTDHLHPDKGQLKRLEREVCSPLGRSQGVDPRSVYHFLVGKILRPEYSIVKSEATIKEVLEDVRRISSEDLPRLMTKDIHRLVNANELRNFVHHVGAVFASSLGRKESRLTHYRQDYPYRDDANWLKWVVVKKVDDELKVEFPSVFKEGDRVKPAEFKKRPAAVQFSSDRPR
ncbi:MAG: FAD-binding protein [Thermodesulfobacteriota bacterium]